MNLASKVVAFCHHIRFLAGNHPIANFHIISLGNLGVDEPYLPSHL